MAALASKKTRQEISVIPTYGISLGQRIVWHYMSVHRDISANEWPLNYSGLAYSDDDGQHWVRDPDMIWRGDTPFGQVAMVGIDPWVYLFGTHGGRWGPIHLARAPAERLFTPGAPTNTGTAPPGERTCGPPHRSCPPRPGSYRCSGTATTGLG